MRRLITILGILVTVTIIISGSAVAQVWHYAVAVTDYYDCLNPDYALYAPNGQHAALGVDTPYQKLGWIILDLGEDNEMGRNQDFTVFASSAVLEYYRVYISVGTTEWEPEEGWFGNDSEDHDFTTPGTPNREWRYIKLVGISGICDPGDPDYGPDIDAVGWYG
jgi:hypothetical protein